MYSRAVFFLGNSDLPQIDTRAWNSRREELSERKAPYNRLTVNTPTDEGVRATLLEVGIYLV